MCWLQQSNIGMEKKFRVIIEQDEDGIYVASVPELKGCHTQAKNLEELKERTREAIQLYLEATSSETEFSLELTGIRKMRVNV